MRAALIVMAAIAGAVSFTQSDPLVVTITAPHDGLLARVTGPGVTVDRGRQLRSGDGYVIVTTPSDVIIDPRRGPYYVRLEPDTAMVNIEVHYGKSIMTASMLNIVVRYQGRRLEVAGVAPGTTPPH